MKVKEVMSLLRISRPTLCKYVKSGIIKTTKLGNNHYDYDEKSVYAFLNKDVKRKTMVYCRVSTSKQKKDLIKFEEIISILHCYSIKPYSKRRINKIKKVLTEEE